jgi:hypothetical protein
MIGSKILVLAGVAVLSAGQSVWAGAPGLQPRSGGRGTATGRLSTGPLSRRGGGIVARPATPYAGSPTIYYSNRPNVQPSIVPPSMNLVPSIGYSTGFNITGMNNLNLGYSTGFNTTGMNGSGGMTNMGLGYSTGFTVTGLGNLATTPGVATLGNRVYSPTVYTYVGPTYGYSTPAVIVNQYYYYQPLSLYDDTTGVPQPITIVQPAVDVPAPRLMFGVLNN